ncbi:hypothetical protein PVAND_006123 [Polypedilum vanderplanki]|uniref:t-SNARE coiled-coil homology domain-containing protein n=1 Tax=Polypedilum vanderplanki TaxID=319348 RepID=A0A9J6C381_POLVA|nr:hypothetical protein PVAND_006123 [Polypedilum vanderplanki]
MSLNRENFQNYGSLDFRRMSQRLSVSTHPTLNEKICLNLILIQDNMRKLNNSYKAIGTTLDSHRIRKEIKNMQKATNDTIEFTSKLIEKLNLIVKSSRAEKHLKIKSEKLISDFKAIYEKFMQLDKSLNVKIHKNHLENIYEENDESEACTSSQFLEKEQQEFLPIDPNFEIELMLEQEKDVNQIESDVYELSQMMKTIDVLINEQAEPVNKIEENVMSTAVDIEEAQVQLRKASKLQNKKRKILLLFLIFLIILIVISTLIILK